MIGNLETNDNKNNLKFCSCCKNWKIIQNNFHRNKARKDGYDTKCNECDKKFKRNKYLANHIEIYFKTRIKHLKERAKKKNIEFNIDYLFLLELFEKQNRKCYYTDINLILGDRIQHYNSISVDRKNPEFGYTKDNIVLCASFVNNFKTNLDIENFKFVLKNENVLNNLVKFVYGTSFDIKENKNE